jgi:hypothetical protein
LIVVIESSFVENMRSKSSKSSWTRRMYDMDVWRKELLRECFKEVFTVASHMPYRLREMVKILIDRGVLLANLNNEGVRHIQLYQDAQYCN